MMKGKSFLTNPVMKKEKKNVINKAEQKLQFDDFTMIKGKTYFSRFRNNVRAYPSNDHNFKIACEYC